MAAVARHRVSITMVFSFKTNMSGAKRLAVAALLSAFTVAPAVTSAKADSINVLVDEAKIVELSRPVTQVIIGNPAIADVTVQSRKTLIFTGKSAGHTNVILLDENDRQILNQKVHVDTSNEAGLVIVQRGSVRSSYHCGSICNGRVALGDDPKFTAEILQSTESKLQFARNAATGSR